MHNKLKPKQRRIDKMQTVFWPFAKCRLLQEVEQAEAEDERRRLLTGTLERRFDRSRKFITIAPSINFSDTFFCVSKFTQSSNNKHKIHTQKYV